MLGNLSCRCRLPRLAASGVLLAAAVFASATPAAAQADPVATAVEALRERLVAELGPDGVVSMPPDTVEALLTAEETALFGEGYITFTVNQPVAVYVYRDDRLDRVQEPFWLYRNGFEPTEFAVEAYGRDFDVWRREFDQGEVGLGIHAFRVVREHYFVSVAPLSDGMPLEITGLTPAYLDTATVEIGTLTYVDRTVTLDAVSPELIGQTLIRTPSDRRPVASIYDYYRLTDYPSSAEPDQIVLSITDDPARSMAVQWRTNTSVDTGAVALWTAADFDRPVRPDPLVFQGSTAEAVSERTVNEPRVHRHSALLTGLAPATEYVYAVGPGDGHWSPVSRFTTAPLGDAAISFLYFGDVQEGFDRFDSVLAEAMRRRPDPAFIVFAGDLVSRGTDADEWDAFFDVAGPILRQVPIVPAVGNHELRPARTADLYRSLFTLPTNGPDGIEAERAYHFSYGGTGVVVLDSNLSADSQSEWLAETLDGMDDAFTFVVAHHAAYTSRPGRYYANMSEHWAPLIEARDNVAMVLQGHDHAYLRTPPMRDGQPSADGSGPYYVISSAGDKFYDQNEAHPYIDVGLVDTQMFQVIDVMRSDDRVIYRAFDMDGDERDRVVISPGDGS